DRVLQQAFRVVLFLRSPIPEPKRGHQSEAPFNQDLSMASHSLKLPEPITPQTFIICALALSRPKCKSTCTDAASRACSFLDLVEREKAGQQHQDRQEDRDDEF